MENSLLENLFEGIQVTSLEDMIAINLVKQHAINGLDKSDKDYDKYVSELEVYVVWKCKVLKNWKYIISTSLLNECVSKDKAIDMLCSEVVKDKE